ncbi:hypothetical protein ACIZ62_15685 [Acetobacterium carbinolicum]|uniref:hypothetical protein n=1 Tax=Acetobacterium carbinolicum TaxID=52690 RepID=UPI0039BED742
MKNIKFEECFLKNMEDNISVEDLKEIHDKRDGSYERQYLDNFYCPECFVAQLSFHPNAKTPHFRSNGIHDKGCSYNFTRANRKEIEYYCNDPENRDTVNRKLKYCLDLLILCGQQATRGKTSLGNRRSIDNPNYCTIEINLKRKSIRRKKLTVPFTEEDYNLPIIFYGTVLLEWDLRNADVKFLRLKNPNRNNYICSIAISKNIYLYIEESMKFNGAKICDMAFLGSMEKKDNFNNCRIKYSTELEIKIRNTK